MRNLTSQKVKLGIFVVVGTVILVAALYFIGNRQHLFNKNIEIYAIFANVNGLIPGNNVRYSGVNVGTVSKIEMIDPGAITVRMLVDDKTSRFIKKDAVASIASDGLVGSMVVNIIPGKGQNETAVLNGDTIRSHSEVGLDAMLSTLNKTNENAALLSSNLLKITNQILEGKGAAGTLLNDSKLAQDIRQSGEAFNKTIAGLSDAVSDINLILSKVNSDQTVAGVFLSDTVSANQVKTVFANLEKSSRNISEMSENLDEYLVKIKTGNGALNYITQNQDFVKNIDSTMVNIKLATEKLNENMEAMRHNFLFRGYFKNQEKKEAGKN